MNEFVHVRMILGFVLSLCLAQLLRGVSKFIVPPTRSRPYAVHLLFVLYIFLDIISFWWWEYRLSQLNRWTFWVYLLVILYIVLYYILCALLFPEDISEYQGYKDYYYARRHWFFGLLALTYPMDALDTYSKGVTHAADLGVDYLVRTVLYSFLCVVAARSASERYHMLLAVVLIVDAVVWIWRYNQLF